MAESELYKYLQISHALWAVIPRGTELPEASPMEMRLLGERLTKKANSVTYRKLINNMPDTPPGLREQWVGNLGDIKDEEWSEALASPREVAIKSGLRLIQLKILHRVYYAKDTLRKMGRCASAECRRGCGGVGTFYHIIWECPIIQRYWSEVLHCCSEVLGETLTSVPKWCLLNTWIALDSNRME